MTEKIRIEYEPLSAVLKWPGNPKKHDEKMLDESIERFGFNDPPAVDEKSGRLVEGHGRILRLEARKNAGKDPPARVAVRKKDGEWLVPILRGIAFENEAEAEAYLLAHNRTGERGGYDAGLLQEAFDRIRDANAEVLGWDEVDIDLLSGADAPPVDPATEWGGMPEYEQEDKTSFRQLIVHFKDQRGVDQFAKAVGQKLTDKTRSIWFPKVDNERFFHEEYVTEDTPDDKP